MNPHQTGPHQTGPHQTGPHQTGPHQTGPHQTGPHQTGLGPPVTSGLHTEREITQQPLLWREVAAGVAARRAEVDALLAPWLERADSRTVLTGAGTSAYAGQVAARWLGQQLGHTVDAVATTDLVADPVGELAGRPTLLVSFARSGQSPESVAATELAEQVLTEVGHLVITCNPEGHLARGHQDRPGSLVLTMPEGSNDQGFAMTSSFTSMTLAALLALGGVGRAGRGQAGTEQAGTGRAEVEVLAAAAADLLTRRSEIERVAAIAPDRVVYLGSGPLLGLARESALKLLELTAGRVVAWAESPLGFRHGPKAVLTPASVVVVYLSNDAYTRRYDLDIVAELVRDLGPDRVLVVDAGGGSPPPGATRIELSGTAAVADPFWALPAALVAQLIGLRASSSLGLTPDNPFPTGEVNRVVRGVTIHPFPG